MDRIIKRFQVAGSRLQVRGGKLKVHYQRLVWSARYKTAPTIRMDITAPRLERTVRNTKVIFLGIERSLRNTP